MARFDPYDKGDSGFDWDDVLRGALTLLHIATALFGGVLLVVAFVFALRVFEVVGNFVEHPDRMREYVAIIRQGDTLLPPTGELSKESTEPASAPDDTKPAPPLKLAKKSAPLNNADVFERTADRVLVILIMGVYAIIPIGMALIGLKIIVAMIARKPAKKAAPEREEQDQGNAPDVDDAELPRRIG
jgi:hypothetical protein